MSQDIFEKEAMKKILSERNGEISLLLGNGFSLARTEFEIFAQKNILETVKTKVKIEGIIELKSAVNQNIEEYIRYLHDYPGFVKFFCDTEYLKRSGIGLEEGQDLHEYCKNLSITFKELTNNFKTKLLEVFGDSHPKTFNDSSSDVTNCVNFLSYFHKIFTINYDLLLYWIVQKANDTYSLKKFKDGFARQEENKNLIGFSHRYPSMNVHFLHGAIHLVNENSSASKIRRNGSGKLVDILDIIKKDNNLQSLMVIEGTSEDKLSVIERNFYLYESLDTLRCLKEDLMIHGCSILNHSGVINNDAHLWRSIMNSKVENIYIGVFENNINTATIRSELNNLTVAGHGSPNIFFYCAKSFGPWLFDGKTNDPTKDD